MSKPDNDYKVSSLIEMTVLNTKLTHIVQRTLFHLLQQLVNFGSEEIRDVAKQAAEDMSAFQTEFERFLDAQREAAAQFKANTGDAHEVSTGNDYRPGYL